jgi:hypothetical protein
MYMAKCIGAEKYFPSATEKEINIQEAKSNKGRENKRAVTTLEEIKMKPKVKGRPNTFVLRPLMEYHRKLFEEFFVIGHDAESLKEVGSKGVALVKPKKLFRYPNLVSEKNW